MSVTAISSYVNAGNQGSASVTLSGAAPAGGIVITLGGRANVIAPPATVTVPAGATSANFTFAALWVPYNKMAELTATYNGVTRSAITKVAYNPDLLREQGGEERADAVSKPVAKCASLALAPCLSGPGIPSVLSTTPGRRYSLYTPELNLMAETYGTSTAVAYEYLWFAGQPVAQFESATNTVHYYFNDHLGTPVLTTDSNGVVDWRVEREPYGKIVATRIGSNRHQPLSFPGQEDDGASDRSYNIFRWYRAGWGRYGSADPMGLTPSLNLYGYVGDNPVRFTDPSGLMRVDSSCLDCPCKAKMMKAVSDFNRFFTPGWGDRNPPCRAALLVMGTSFSAPDGTPPITCMARKTRDMVVKCAAGGTGCGGPPNMLSIDFNTVWVQPGVCSGLCGNPVNTLFHEALHNCGAPDERYRGGYIAERVADICVGR